MTTDYIEAETREITTTEQPGMLFGTTNPTEHINRAVETATALKDVIAKRGLIANIAGKQYVLYDGWTLLASLVGTSPVEDWTRPLPDGNGWEARVMVMRGGQIIGAAEAMCTRDEKRWARADEFSLRSMAQTRAGAKALRTCLGFIVQLAGYEATPYDEMPQDTYNAPPSVAARSNNSEGTCPECHAPAGKPHATKCALRDAP